VGRLGGLCKGTARASATSSTTAAAHAAPTGRWNRRGGRVHTRLNGLCRPRRHGGLREVFGTSEVLVDGLQVLKARRAPLLLRQVAVVVVYAAQQQGYQEHRRTRHCQEDEHR
jgi:hypothetical protein